MLTHHLSREIYLNKHDILLKAFNQVEKAVVRRDCLRNVSRASSLLRENISLDGREQTCYQAIQIGWIN